MKKLMRNIVKRIYIETTLTELKKNDLVIFFVNNVQFQ